MIHLFTGHDQREAIGWYVFVSSALRHTRRPVALHRLDACGLPQGSNAFTLSRFLVPWFMGYHGRAIFVDGADMLALDDLGALDDEFDQTKAVQVVKHDYVTRNATKYIGTTMECPNPHYTRKNWASVMLFNCAHPFWRSFDPAALECANKLKTLQFAGLADADIGALPDRWNRIVDEGQPLEGAGLVHWTAGIPGLPHYAGQPGADLWRAELKMVLEAP